MWLKKLQEAYDLINEHEKGIRSRFTGYGNQKATMNTDERIGEMGGQVVRCGKVGRYNVYLSFKPFGEIGRLKRRIEYLKMVIKKKGDRYINSEKAKEELEDISSKEHKAINYLWNKSRGIKKGKGVVGFIRFLSDLINSVGNIQGVFTGQSAIYDRGSNMILVDDSVVDKAYNWAVEECTAASEFFDGLGLPTGKNIPLVVEVDEGVDHSGGSAVRAHHYISLKYLHSGTLVHETAHYMWFYSMDSDMRKKLALYYLTKVKGSVAGPSGGERVGSFSAASDIEFAKDKSKYGKDKGKQPVLPSGYATFNPSELWAEIIKAMSKGKASEEMKKLFRIVVMGEVSDLIKYFNIDPEVAESYLSGDKVEIMNKAINMSGKKPEGK